ncbi:MAG: methylated-DNA--[protein]-cysteine S-methyltransferase [Bacteroidota bacterium]
MDQHQYQRIEQALVYLHEHFQEQPSLEEVAAQVHMSPYHFQRMFVEWAGVSPKKFTQYLTIDYAKQKLREGATTLQSAYGAGLSSQGRLHDLFVSILSMTPGEYAKEGGELTIYYGLYASPLGQMLMASTSKGICKLSFGETEEMLGELRDEWSKAELVEDRARHEVWVEQMFSRRISADRIPINLRATPFQLQVWEALLKIPEGQLVSYGDLARAIGRPKASRAVGTAIGKNPVGYLIPCHRVIRSMGGFGEYRWNRNRKLALLAWEASRTDA